MISLMILLIVVFFKLVALLIFTIVCFGDRGALRRVRDVVLGACGQRNRIAVDCNKLEGLKMATAEEELRLATMNAGILTRCALDEPVFILRAQDDLAADLVDLWAVRANGLGCPWDKVREAKDIAQRMREWPHRKNPD